LPSGFDRVLSPRIDFDFGLLTTRSLALGPNVFGDFGPNTFRPNRLTWVTVRALTGLLGTWLTSMAKLVN
jgi:hypothetical protein